MPAAGKQLYDIAGDPDRYRVGAVNDFETRHRYGSAEAPIMVLEFGDFECPYCAAAAPVLRELVDSSQGRFCLVFRHFPLFEPHPHALTAALFAEAAGVQGKFWPTHDLLFEHQRRLTDRDLLGYADKLGLDSTSVVGDPAQQFGPAVQEDYAAGTDLGVHGTPTLFINGDPYLGKVEVGELRTAGARSLRGRRT